MRTSAPTSRTLAVLAFGLSLVSVAACAPPEVIAVEEGLPGSDPERPLDPEDVRGNPDDEGEKPGDEEPGDDEQPGDEVPGDEEPGDEEPADEEPGDEEPGDEEPGDEEPGEPDDEQPPEDEGPVTLPPQPGCKNAQVSNTGGANLRVRPTPATTGAPVTELAINTIVEVLAVVQGGEDVGGTDRWYRIRSGGHVGFVSAAFATCVNLSEVPGYFLPLQCRASAVISQGNNSPYSHKGEYGAYSFDFALGRGTPLYAMEDGYVVAVYGGTGPDSSCWAGGGPECVNQANFVVLHHADGSQTGYVHLDSPSVVYGQEVRRGELVGYSGGTGWSTGPHAHIQRQTACVETIFCPNLELRFVDVPGDGVPVVGQSVTSLNCQ